MQLSRKELSEAQNLIKKYNLTPVINSMIKSGDLGYKTRIIEAIYLRNKGLEYREIGEILKVSHASAHNYLTPIIEHLKKSKNKKFREFAEYLKKSPNLTYEKIQQRKTKQRQQQIKQKRQKAISTNRQKIIENIIRDRINKDYPMTVIELAAKYPYSQNSISLFILNEKQHGALKRKRQLKEAERKIRERYQPGGRQGFWKSENRRPKDKQVALTGKKMFEALYWKQKAKSQTATAKIMGVTQAEVSRLLIAGEKYYPNKKINKAFHKQLEQAEHKIRQNGYKKSAKTTKQRYVRRL